MTSDRLRVVDNGLLREIAELRDRLLHSIETNDPGQVRAIAVSLDELVESLQADGCGQQCESSRRQSNWPSTGTCGRRFQVPGTHA